MKALLIGASGILGTAATASAGMYFHSSEYIWDKVAGQAIPKNKPSLDTVWKEIKVALKSKNNIKDPELLNLQKEESQDTDGSKLKNWCFKAYDLSFKNIFKKANTDLLEDVKQACVLTIKEKLNSNALSETEETDKTTYQARLNELKSYNETHENPKLDEALKGLKEVESKTSEPEKNWKKLQEWCSKIYKVGFQREDINEWKLANKFCNKSPASA